WCPEWRSGSGCRCRRWSRRPTASRCGRARRRRHRRRRPWPRSRPSSRRCCRRRRPRRRWRCRPSRRTPPSSAVDFWERGLGRIDERWVGHGEGGARFYDDAHPYARDLDLFGKGSLFELLCTARTRTGEETLARMLLVPADAAEARARQDAVKELRTRLDLREKLALAGEDVRAEVDPAGLSRWGAAAPVLAASVAWIAVALVSVGATVTLVGWFAQRWNFVPVAIALPIVAGVMRLYRDRVGAVH